ncbi:MAG: hypothetical protein FJZ87_13815 [Chloroflexi bacterium]|nr:hypothetical protein [Chloroflexota bacterium]
MNPLRVLLRKPIFILLGLNLLAGLATYADYGLSWDEPLFYDYAESLKYAYSPAEWFSGDFDLSRAFGASGSDHANRGPAYLLLATLPVGLLEKFGLGMVESWHLVNFFTFQFGVYLFYRLAVRWFAEPSALASTAIFAYQPLLWGHAFINPKDSPFLVFFLAAVTFGFEAVDELARKIQKPTLKILLAAFFLGIATSIRVLGPFAGMLVCLYGLFCAQRGSTFQWVKSLLLYVSITLGIALASWPYLWTNPIANFTNTIAFMSDNPTQLKVLFDGALFAADQLPRRYLMTMMGLTLTEPVWILLALGVLVFPFFQDKRLRKQFFLILLWFLVPFAYVLLRKPPMYDGIRHFFFILPPVFVFVGLALDSLLLRMKWRTASAVLLALILFPSLLAILSLHPFQYTYYNSLAGGMEGAFRRYETDYWLTCYKQAMEDFQSTQPASATLFVNREAYIAQSYASDSLKIFERRGAADQIRAGDYFLVNTRANEDLRLYPDSPILLQVGRSGAIFCVLKQIE